MQTRSGRAWKTEQPSYCYQNMAHGLGHKKWPRPGVPKTVAKPPVEAKMKMAVGTLPCGEWLYKTTQIASGKCNMCRRALKERATSHGRVFSKDKVPDQTIDDISSGGLGATSSVQSRTPQLFRYTHGSCGQSLWEGEHKSVHKYESQPWTPK